MLYRARTHREVDGAWVASAIELPLCWSRATTQDEALRKLRAEIRYRMELCPCSSVDDEFVQVVLVAEEGRPRVGADRGSERPASTPSEPGRRHPAGWRRWDD